MFTHLPRLGLGLLTASVGISSGIESLPSHVFAPSLGSVSTATTSAAVFSGDVLSCVIGILLHTRPNVPCTIQKRDYSNYTADLCLLDVDRMQASSFAFSEFARRISGRAFGKNIRMEHLCRNMFLYIIHVSNGGDKERTSAELRST